MPRSLRTGILNVSHYFVLENYPDERRIYDSLRREFYWLHMVSDVYSAVSTSTGYPRIGTTFYHQRKLDLSPCAGFLGFVAIDVLGPIPGIISCR